MAPLAAAFAQSSAFSPFASISNNKLDELFLNSQSASQTMRSLYVTLKNEQKKFSLTFLCRRAGIPSKGYLALVMSGERKLHSKYWLAICQAFKLENLHEEILRTQLELDQIDCVQSKLRLHRRLDELRTSLHHSAHVSM